MTRALHRLVRFGQWAIVILGALGLVVSIVWLAAERRWGAWEPLDDEQAFVHGTLGLEFAALKYVLVMEEVSGDMFRRGSDYTNWVESYGFLPNPKSTGAAKVCLDNAATEVPVGISISNLLPMSAAPVPVAFAGFTCAACHSSRLDTADGPGEVLYGPGSVSLDLIAWVDAFKNALADPELTVAKIQDAYAARCGDDQSLLAKKLEGFLIGAWLGQIRDATLSGAQMYDLPFARDELLDPHKIPAGPSRTRPFRSVVRTALLLPGADNLALSKVPAALEQNHVMRDRSQYDGSIADYVTRSMIAAYTSGASIVALARPEIEHNVRAAARHTLYLGAKTAPTAPQDGGVAAPLPTFAESFPAEPIDPQLVARGFEIYQRHCNVCHGHRPLDGGDWSSEGAVFFHKISWLDPADGAPTIDTDPARVDFRYASILPLSMQTAFPGDVDEREGQLAAMAAAKSAAISGGRGTEAAMWEGFEKTFDANRRQFPLGHPFYFDRGILRDDKGYYNNPIPLAYLRAPYLHNGSVPTMRQFLHLDPRPDRFCRGWNRYDPAAMGIATALPTPAGDCPAATPFLYDASQPGNSNHGHDYPPWALREDRTPEQSRNLEALLEYLRTV